MVIIGCSNLLNLTFFKQRRIINRSNDSAPLTAVLSNDKIKPWLSLRLFFYDKSPATTEEA
jgi:hypothetical protein